MSPPSAAFDAFVDAREVFIKKLLELKPVDGKINATGVEAAMVRNSFNITRVQKTKFL